ncbi:MAG: acetyl-CoA decarbonylase/synthase complex subunit delta [Caldiserica bacterium]|nr:acetyl-CoA decarbonylase/synthase complex subunit delta [Caldisericota bacterium]
MSWEIPKIQYKGKIREVTLGTGEKAVTVGGESCYPFHDFEGEIPSPPVIAYEIWDHAPQNWPEAVRKPYEDVLKSPSDWAKKCVQEYGANLITVQLLGIDPHGINRPVDEEIRIIEEIVKAVEVPLIFWGCDDVEKDASVLRKIAEVCEGRNVALAPVADKNYKQIGASAIAYKHVVIASTPIDVNLAKQLNILLLDLGVPENKLLMDPTTGGLGYGIEYTYSVMERDRIAALVQEDEKLAFPMICNLAKEVWKVKEVAIPVSKDPKMGKEEERGIMMEAITASLLALAGADILVMRHPRAIGLISELIEELGA